MKSFLFFYFLIMSGSVLAAENIIETDRYTIIKIAPSKVQLSPLEVVVDVAFPQQIITIEGAVNYLLDESGFELISKDLRTKELSIMLTNRLPVVHRDLTPMMLKDALGVLLGKHFRLINDPLRRKVSFVLREEYKGLVGE